MYDQRFGGYVDVKNDDFKIALDEYEATILIVGRNESKRGDRKILTKQGPHEFELKPSGTAQIPLETIVTSYDDDDDDDDCSSNIGGYKYNGYVIILKHKSSGNNVGYHSSSGALLKTSKENPEEAVAKILALRSGQKVGMDITK